MTELVIGQFEECKSCAKKPGSPTLCEPCLHNRKTISELNEVIYKQTKKIKLVNDLLLL
jgi:hypothetical protein